MEARQSDSAVGTLLAAASTEKETPAELRSRRHAVAAARDAPSAAAEHLDTVWEIYFAEIERPISTVEEFAQIDDYSTDIREACAEVFVAVADTEGQRLANRKSNLLRAIRVEQVEPIRETLVETAGSLLEERIVPEWELVDVLCEVGKTTDEIGTVRAVASVLGTYSNSEFDEAIQRHAATALESIAQHQQYFTVFTLGQLGRIGVKNRYNDLSITAVDQLATAVDDDILGNEHAELDQQLRDIFFTGVKSNDWDAVKSTYLLETVLEVVPVYEPEVMEPILEMGVDMKDEHRLRELMEFASDATFDLGTWHRYGGLTELETIGRETGSTAVRREVFEALNRMVQETDGLHFQVATTTRIRDLGEYIEDASLRRDTVAMLERALEADEYLVRSATADALGKVAASGTSIELLSQVLDVLRTEFTTTSPEPLHSARKPILEIGIRSDNPDVQAMVLGLVRSIVAQNHDGAVEIFRHVPELLDALDSRLGPEAVAVIRAAVWNDYPHVSAAGVNAISGAWLVVQPAEIQRSIRRTLFDAALHDGASDLTKQNVIQTCLEFVDEGGDRQLLLPVLFYLAGSDNDLTKLFAMATLARFSTDRADAILGSLMEDDETAVNIGVAWGRGDLPVDPPSSATDHRDVLKTIHVAAAPDHKRTEQVVLSELRFGSSSDFEMTMSPDDDLDVVVARILTSGTLQLRRETVDLLQERADGFRTSLRRRLVETLSLGMTDENGSVGSATADAVAQLCVTTDDQETWDRGIEVLRKGVTFELNQSVDGAAEALAEMAASAPSDIHVQPIREALYAAIVNGGGRSAVVEAVEGIIETGPEALDLQRVLVSPPECRSTLGEASRHRDISDRGVSVAIDMAANTKAVTSLSAAATDE